MLTVTQVMRAFECQQLPDSGPGSSYIPLQNPMNAPTVFNFYPPNHKIPGTSLVAPEHRLLNGESLGVRAGNLSYRVMFQDDGAAWRAAGCDLAGWERAAGSAEMQP